MTPVVKQKGGKFTDQEIDQYYEIILQYKLSRVKYVKNKNIVSGQSEHRVETSWEALLWNGTEENKQRLPEETR